MGDTFRVGGALDPRIVHAELFDANPDRRYGVYASADDTYRRGCGLDALLLSFGHDEYLYRAPRPYVPELVGPTPCRPSRPPDTTRTTRTGRPWRGPTSGRCVAGMLLPSRRRFLVVWF